ncbi:MAG TPA: hypothetical protein VM425_04625 [Myxococcota bacterium]|nr:hypothetical protein [Myxococcota bacterium]
MRRFFKGNVSRRATLLAIVVLVWAVISCFSQSARADFKLPILNPVTKIISVPPGIDPAVLGRFAGLRDLVIELRMTRGNLIPGRLMQLLTGKFQNVPKRLILFSEIKPNHATQIHRLANLEVQYEVNAGGLRPETENQLYSLGPVHKILILNEKFASEAARRAGRMKFTSIGVRIRKSPLSAERIDLLCLDHKRPKLVILPADTKPKDILDLTVISPLQMEIYLNNNRLEDDLRQVLSELRGINVTLVVDGTLTLEDAKKFTAIERFKLKVQLDEQGSMIPGLIQLLGKIAPP